MGLLKSDLRISAGLLKEAAPDNHLLAYITPNERDMLVQAGGSGHITKSGIPSFEESWDSSVDSGGWDMDDTGGADYSSEPTGGSGSDSSSDSGDYEDEQVGTPYENKDVGGPASRTNIEDIHGEWDDPDSVSYDPTYNPVTQAKATKKSAMGSGKHSGAWVWDSKTQKYFRVTDFTWKEHYDKAPDILKWSPTLRSIYATGKNIGEWATRKGWSFDSKTGTVNDGQGNNIGERDLMNAASADAPYVASGMPVKSAPDSMAAKWFNQLGGSAGNFNLTSAFADAKAKQQQILGNTTPVGLLAANQTGYFNFLKDNSLTKGIL
jgi:hypothetical protein